MALRIDFFSVAPGSDLERLDLTSLIEAPAPPADVATRWEGHVSASDADEGALVELAALWSTHGVLDGVGVQGICESPREVNAHDAAALIDIDGEELDALAAGSTSSGQIREWAGVAGHCATESVATSRHFGWWTRFDTSGTVNDGPDEWQTGSSIRELA